MKNIIKISTTLIILILLGSCQSKAVKENNNLENNNIAPSKKNSNSVSLQKNQVEVMNIKLGAVKQVNLGATLKVNGQLELPPQRKASVSAIVGGQIQSISVIEGDYVKKGQVIALLNNPEFITMQQKYLMAKNNFTFLEKDYIRKKNLLKDNITSLKAFQKAKSAYNNGKAELNASKYNLQLLNINIKGLEQGKIVSAIPVAAPIKGFIENIKINIGKFVAPEQEMFEIVDNEHLHLGLKIFEKDIDKVKVGQKISFSLATRPGKIYKAEIFAIGKAFDMNTRSVKLHAKIIGAHKNLLPGMFVEARIATTRKEVNALPKEAFINEKGLDYVFVQKNKKDGKIEFEKVHVNKGISDLGFTEVLFSKKLPKNTLFAINGAYYLNAEMQKSEFADED